MQGGGAPWQPARDGSGRALCRSPEALSHKAPRKLPVCAGERTGRVEEGGWQCEEKESWSQGFLLLEPEARGGAGFGRGWQPGVNLSASEAAVGGDIWPDQKDAGMNLEPTGAGQQGPGPPITCMPSLEVHPKCLLCLEGHQKENSNKKTSLAMLRVDTKVSHVPRPVIRHVLESASVFASAWYT